jgi:hypothetical protein
MAHSLGGIVVKDVRLIPHTSSAHELGFGTHAYILTGTRLRKAECPIQTCTGIYLPGDIRSGVFWDTSSRLGNSQLGSDSSHRLQSHRQGNEYELATVFGDFERDSSSDFGCVCTTSCQPRSQSVFLSGGSFDYGREGTELSTGILGEEGEKL